MQLKADKFTVSLWHNTMINFAITICVTCHCKMKLLANWNETPKTKPSHEEYTRSVIIMESGKTWYGLTNPKIFSSITNVVHFPCGNRQAPYASKLKLPNRERNKSVLVCYGTWAILTGFLLFLWAKWVQAQKPNRTVTDRHRPPGRKGKRQISFYIHARNHRFLSSLASRIEHSPNSICWL